MVFNAFRLVCLCINRQPTAARVCSNGRQYLTLRVHPEREDGCGVSVFPAAISTIGPKAFAN
jgi:hypothetical protein